MQVLLQFAVQQIVLLRMKRDQAKLDTEQIWLKLSNQLRQFVKSRVNSDADIDDILQTVFIRIHRKLSDLQNAERLESWVFQITRNAIIDHFRKFSKTTKRYVSFDEKLLVDTPDEKELENSNSVIADCLITLIEHLPIDQGRAVRMYELEELSQKEIAEIENISLSGAKSRIQRGRKNLENILRACCELELDRRGNIIECGKDACKCETQK